MATITKDQTLTAARLRALGYADARPCLDGVRAEIRPNLILFVMVADNAYRGEIHDHGCVRHFHRMSLDDLRTFLARF